ncbi:MAG: 1-deoxy-D-xylulose-5-phosphate reductoisomerase [Lachnospiraceae bacterium]|nr:1-deoxy-D-xylulose-5-phosphate reductoisomerase [Lachnospiraceae bacterium]
MKNVCLLGSTGSIGTQTLKVIAAHPDRLCVCALAAGRNAELVEKQIRQFHPLYAVMYDEKAAARLKTAVADTNTLVLSGMEGLEFIASCPEADIVLGAIVGMIGLKPTIAAIKAGKDIALANKETLVCAGHIIMPLAKRMGVKLLPVDSEHSAIFQSMDKQHGNRIEKILLTASGGPFRGRKASELVNVRPEDALKHPNWSMGAKITIDSSTMVNKGLEVIEARWLFDVDYDRIQVVIQPQSVIHSMVEFDDGAVIAQLGTPDMKLPIQYALLYPDRLPIQGGSRLDFYSISSIGFEKPDMDTFRGLPLAYEAGRRGGNMPTIFNAANELAVAAFLAKKIGYLDIYDSIEYACSHATFINDPDIDEVLLTQEEVSRLLAGRLSEV